MRGDFELVTHPQLAPAADFITRSTVGPFVDTGVDVILRTQPGMPVQRERVYLAVGTIAHLAQVSGVGGHEGITKEREAQLIAIGKLEGMKENLGGNLADVAHTLRRVLDAVGSGGGRDGGASAL